MAAPGGASAETSSSPSVDGLEESLQKLHVWVDGFASSWSFDTDPNSGADPDTTESPSAPRPGWQQVYNAACTEPRLGNKQLSEAERFLKPNHLAESWSPYPALTHLGLPVFSASSVSRVAGLLGSEAASENNLLSPKSFPVKLGAPHVTGVKSLSHPKVPLRTCSPARVTSFLGQGSAPYVKRSRNYQSRSFSPASKKSCWQRSRSQSPKSTWRPNSAQPLPNFGRFRCSRKTTASTRQSRSRSHKLGSLAARSRTPTRVNAGGILSSSWSSSTLPAATTSSPAAQHINGRYEMRSSQFHYEAHKNKELLRNGSEAAKTCSLQVTAARN